VLRSPTMPRSSSSSDSEEDDKVVDKGRKRGPERRPAPPPPPPAPPPPSEMTPRELLERALRARVVAKQRLGELSRDSRDNEMKLRQLHYEERSYGRVGPGKRSRDDDTAEGEANKAARGDAEMAGGDVGDAKPAGGGGAEEEADDGSKAEAPATETSDKPDAAGDSAAPDASAPEDAGAAPAALSVEVQGRSAMDVGQSPRVPTPSSTRSKPSPRNPRMQQDADTQKRNRKMFGLLRGTLQRAKADVEVSKDKSLSLQQQKLEKVESKLRTDRTKLFEFQQTFLTERKTSEVTRRASIRVERNALDERLMRLTWDAHALALSSFLKTDAGPQVYYMPRLHNDSTRAKLKEQQQQVLKHLAESPLMQQDPLALDLDASAPTGLADPLAEPQPGESLMDAPADDEADDEAAADAPTKEASDAATADAPADEAMAETSADTSAKEAELEPIEEPVSLDLS